MYYDVLNCLKVTSSFINTFDYESYILQIYVLLKVVHVRYTTTYKPQTVKATSYYSLPQSAN